MQRSCCLLTSVLCAATAALLEPRPVGAAGQPPAIYEQFVGNAVAGEALSAFEWVTATTHADPKAEALAAKYLSRFVLRAEAQSPTGIDPVVGAALEFYREYWRTVLMSDLPTEQAEAVLEKRILRLLAANAMAPNADEDFTSALQRAIEQRGYRAITGRTLPYLELMVWTDVEDTRFQVQLTDQKITVPVTFISGLLSRGWVDFATVGAASSAGWARTDGLTCVKDDYDIASETFRIHYLAHEARHFADYQRYPKLKSHDLEYRAKLTELVYAETTLRPTLAKFVANGRADATSPHAYAEFVLVRNLARRLLESESPGDDTVFAAIPEMTLRSAAAALLEEFDRAAGRGSLDQLESLIL